MRIILLIAVLVNALNAYGQLDLKKKVSIHVDNSSLEDVLALLQAKHEVKLSYGFDNVSRDIHITLHSESISVYEIIQTICKQGSLEFLVIDNTIVFKYRRHAHKSIAEREAHPQRIHQGSSPDVNAVMSFSDTVVNTNASSLQMRVADADSMTTTSATFVLKQVAVKSDETRSARISPVSRSNSRVKRRWNIQTGLFISYSIDFNRFAYNDPEVSEQKFKTGRNESYSLGGYFLFSKKLYISLGAGYVTKNFRLHYNSNTVVDPNDPLPIPDKTYVDLKYLETPVTFGYALSSKGKYSTFVSAGFYPSFLVGEKENTTYRNQGNSDTHYFLQTNQRTLFSSSLGFIVHRYINRSCGVFIEPSYLCFFEPINNRAMYSHSCLFRLKTGIHFAFLGRQ